jgi:hypothetical protein
VTDPAANGGGTGGEQDGETTAGESTGNIEPGEVVLHEEPHRELDLLIVVDNSQSTASLGAKLAAAIEPAIDVLEAEDVRADYRLAVTTTDSGNVMCDQITSPERGRFVDTSCRQRLSEFTTPLVDETAACIDPCELETLDLSRPWIAAETLPDGVAARQVARCLVPQGISGCGFESPLESMRRALELARDPSSPQFGFLRDEAVLAIVIVTDEADCSAAPAHQEAVFGPEHGGVFWPFPEEPFPNSAVCWNAGVQCTGSPAAYDSCDPADKGVDGQPATGADAVLVPVQDYIDFVQAIEDDKQALDLDREVYVSVVAGVPLDYGSTGDIDYARGPDADDPNSFQGTFGIGPGCSTDAFEAVPPVRLRAFADAFRIGDDPNLFSVCAGDFTEAIVAFVEPLRDPIRPACVPVCVADLAPSPGVQPNCTMYERWTQDGAPQEIVIQQCGPDDALPAGANVCWVPLHDQTGLTETILDDMQAACIDEGWNLEVRIVRREGFPIASGATISIVCDPSPAPALDCPELP